MGNYSRKFNVYHGEEFVTVIPLKRQHAFELASEFSRIKYRCRLVLYVNGEKVVTDIKINDGNWHFLCVTWESERGSWRVSVDGIVKDSGVGLAQGTGVRGSIMSRILSTDYLASKTNHKIPDIVPFSQRIPRHRTGTGSPGRRFLRIGGVPREARLVGHVGCLSERERRDETVEHLRKVSWKPRGLGADAAVHSR